MAEKKLHHSVKIDIKRCIGCVACMKACPTKAIRVNQDRKAKIIYSRCIDCGECLRVCPYDAVVPIITTRADLKKYKYKVALPSPVLYSQFGLNVLPEEILSILKGVGFDYVYDLTSTCEMTSMVIEEYLNENKTQNPKISSACPVVLRLIQRLFPSLCGLIIPIEVPREVAAKNLREKISRRENIPKDEIGIIHITPCAAKMVSINYPESMKKSFLDGAISIHEIFNTMMMRLKKSKPPLISQIQNPISGIGIGWTIPGGEVRGLKYHSIAVSGIHKTIEILKDVEAGKIKNIDYLECNVCPDSCIGGPLTVENRFIAKSNVQMLVRVYSGKRTVNQNTVRRLYKEGFFSFESGVKPKPFPPLDKNTTQAIKKLNLKEKIIKKLPGIDCGVCGAPDCITLADDIARNKAFLTDCIFIKEKVNEKKSKN